MPIWIALPWSIAMTAAVFWQPRWVHRLFDGLCRCADRLIAPLVDLGGHTERRLSALRRCR